MVYNILFFAGNFVGDGDDFMTGQESGANAQGKNGILGGLT